MRPVRVAALEAFTRRFRHARIALEPAIHFVVIELFTPEHSGKGLPLHAARIFRQIARCKAVIELIRFLEACRKNTVKVLRGKTQALLVVGKSQLDRLRLSWRKRQHVLSRCFCPHMIRIDCVLLALDDIIVKAVFHVPGTFLIVIESAGVGFIFREEQRRLALAKQPSEAIVVMLRLDDAHLVHRLPLLEPWAPDVRSPGPCVAIPDRRKQHEFGLLGATIYHLNTDAEIFRRRLRILHKNIEVAVFVEDAAVGQFKLRILTPSTAILLN